MRDYVVGIPFVVDGGEFGEVLLQTKDNPPWQRGRLNGPGGKVEFGESADEAMVREFREECGINAKQPWELRIILTGDGWRVFFYSCVLEFTEARLAYDFSSTTNEPLSFEVVERIASSPTLPNLRWIIPLMLDADVQFPVEVRDRTKQGEGATRAAGDQLTNNEEDVT